MRNKQIDPKEMKSIDILAKERHELKRTIRDESALLRIELTYGIKVDAKPIHDRMHLIAESMLRLSQEAFEDGFDPLLILDAMQTR